MQIQVIGAGCPTCKKLFELTQEIIDEMGRSETVEYIADITKLLEIGIMQSPVLVINGEPVMIGFFNNKDKIRELVEQHQ